MVGAIEMSHLALVETLMKALQGVRHAPASRVSLPRFIGAPTTLVGARRRERYVKRMRFVVTSGSIMYLLRLVFGPCETVTSVYAELYLRMQSLGDTLAEYSRALIRLHQRIEGALTVIDDSALKHQFVVGSWDEWGQHQLRRLILMSADKYFIVVWDEAMCLRCEEEARVSQMRPVENAAPTLSGPVGGSVSCVLDDDVVVLGDGGVSSRVEGSYVSVGDVSVAVGGDTELRGVDTVLWGAISGGLCELDRLSGGGDTDMSGVDTVVSGADTDRVS